MKNSQEKNRGNRKTAELGIYQLVGQLYGENCYKYDTWRRI